MRKMRSSGNQSRMRGKRVGLVLFPSDLLELKSYDFNEVAHIKLLYGVERLHKSFCKSYGEF